ARGRRPRRGSAGSPSRALHAPELVVEVFDRAALLERHRVAPGAIGGDEALADDAAAPPARHLHALAQLDAPRRWLHQRPNASTWTVRMAGSLGRRATKRAAPPGGISCGVG